MSGNCLISKNVPLAESVQSFLYEYGTSNDTSSGYKTIGGIFSNSKYVWYANGSRFEVVESRTGRKIASWMFGSLIKDTTTKVNCLAEIPGFTKEIPLVILGLECSLTGGIICVFDILTSKVLRAIQVDDKVTCVHVVDCGSNIFQIFGPLRAFDGVVAVGLAGGDVLLVDLCQQCIDDVRSSISSEDIKDEMDPCQIISLTIKDINEIEHHKQEAVQSGHHLAIYLNAVFNNKLPHFTLKGPKGEDRVHVNKVEVIVTSIFYCSQLGSLLIGYNFGAWQIWDIINMVLIYTSPVYDENIPISHFTVQEPADDPRAFCYLWAVYSHSDQDNVGFPVAVLYSLSYEAKDFHEGYGYLYQNLQSCAVRFQVELSTLGSLTKTVKGACCLRLTSYNKGFTNRPSMQESHEDTLTICSMVWNVWHTNGIDTYISIFDLNQWYKAQMPNSPQQDCFTYLSYICVSDVLGGINNDSLLLDTYIDESSITQFIGIQKPEEHYYPTALAYEFCTCSETNLTFVHNKGQQRALLGYFESTGPLLLSKPKEIFQQALQLGLTPIFTEGIQTDLNLQREFLLNVALEHQMIAFLCKCASTWSNGSFSCVGCSLEFFLSWCWNRVVTLKTNTDKLCEPLFDYSEVSLDTNNQKLLSSCIIQLSNLHRLYKFMSKKLDLFELTADIVQEQEKSLHMTIIYLEVLQWLVNIGLLPEFSESGRRTNKLDTTGIRYPIESLMEYYREKRSFLQSLDVNISRKAPLLYIDHLIEHKIGESLKKFWEDDGGDGFYPPPSLQSLLRTYLIEDVDLLHKHSVVIYVFLDLAMALDQSRYKFAITHLIKFPAVFKIDSSLIKIIQAFWQLDHSEFGTAIEQFSDPTINTSDLQTWHHRIIMNAFLVQGHHNFALLYFQIRKPPIENVQDITKILSMYVLNHMLDEAINFARQYSSRDNDAELFYHIFKECHKTKQNQKLLYYPLTSKEEEILMTYLKEISFKHLEDFQVSYYLNRSRYMDIFKIKSEQDKFQPSGLAGQDNSSYRTNVMKTIQYYLPKVSRDIIDICQHDKDSLRSEVSRPQPMSVFIHNAKYQATSKSSLIRTGILKAREIWTHPVLEKSFNEEIPFIGTSSATPSTIRRRSSIICSKLITSDISKTNEDDVSPPKRMRMTPRKSLIEKSSQLSSSGLNISNAFDSTKLLTPIVKRKVKRPMDSYTPSDEVNTYTPQSILKVKYDAFASNKILEKIQEKSKDDENPVPKNVILISPKGRSSYRDPFLSILTDVDPNTSTIITTELSSTADNHSITEKNESAVQSKIDFKSVVPSPKRILSFTKEGSIEPMPPDNIQIQSPPSLSPRKTTRSMRGKSEEPILPYIEDQLLPPSSLRKTIKEKYEDSMSSPSAQVQLTPRKSAYSIRGKSEEPLPFPGVQIQSPSQLSPRKTTRSMRGKSEEPIASSDVQIESPSSLSPRKATRSTRGKSEEPMSFSGIHLESPLLLSPRRTTRSMRGKSEEPMPSSVQSILSVPLSPKRISLSARERNQETPLLAAPLSPRRASLRLNSRKSLSRKVLENNAYSIGRPHDITEVDHLEGSNKSLRTDVSGESSEDIVGPKVTQEPHDITGIPLHTMDNTSIDDSAKVTEKVDYENKISVEEAKSDMSSISTFSDEKEKNKIDIKPVRRSSFRIESRKSLSRMVLENNTFTLRQVNNTSSASTSQNLTQSELLEQSKSHLFGSDVAGTSSLGSEDFSRILNQNKFDDVLDFSLSPIRNTSSTTLDISKNTCDDRNKTDTTKESLLPNSTFTSRLDDINKIEQRRSSIRSRRLLGRTENNPSLIGTSTPCHSNQNSFVEKSSASLWAEKKLDSLIENQTFDVPNFSLSYACSSSSVYEQTKEEAPCIDLSSKIDADLDNIGNLDTDPNMQSSEISEINQLLMEEDASKLKDVVLERENQVIADFICESPEKQVEVEQHIEETEKDDEGSNMDELLHEESQSDKELDEENDELNQGQLLNTEVIEIADSSSSKSEESSENTSFGSSVSNASTFGENNSKGEDIDDFSASDDTSNERCETSDDFYDANNAVLVLDDEDMNEHVEEEEEHAEEEEERVEEEEEHVEEEESVLQDMLEKNVDSEALFEELQMDVDIPQLDESDSECQSAQPLNTPEQNSLEKQKPGKEESVVQSDSALHEENKEEVKEELQGTVEEENHIVIEETAVQAEVITEEIFEDKQLEQNSHEKEQDAEKLIIPSDNVLYEEDNREEINVALESLNEEQHDVAIEQPYIDLVEEKVNIQDLDDKQQVRESENLVIQSNIVVEKGQNLDQESVPIERAQNKSIEVRSNSEEKPILEYTDVPKQSKEKTKEVVKQSLGTKKKVSEELDKDEGEPILEYTDVPKQSKENTKVVVKQSLDIKKKVSEELDKDEGKPILEYTDVPKQSKEKTKKVVKQSLGTKKKVSEELDKDKEKPILEYTNVPKQSKEKTKEVVKQSLGTKKKVSEELDKDEEKPILEYTNVPKQSKENTKVVVKQSQDIKKRVSEELDKDAEMSSEGVYFFDDMTIEPCNVTDVTITDIFDMNDIEKTVYVNISSTDIIDKALLDSSLKVEQKSLEEINENKCSELSHDEIDEGDQILQLVGNSKQVINKPQIKEVKRLSQDVKRTNKHSAESPASPHMQLRKRSLSSTAEENKLDRTLRKRSASFEEISIKQKVSSPSPSTSKSSAARRSKRTTSVSSLPVILEEPAKSIKKEQSRKSQEENQDEEKQVVDNIETYSTSRRLTRSQKNLLQKSKLYNIKKMSDESLETLLEVTTADDIQSHSSPSNASEHSPRGRMTTRRMSQESTSSITSRSSRTTRKHSETGDDDDHSTVSLRRSTRQRSKTPDIGVPSKSSDGGKKHSSKISEVGDVKEEPPAKRGKSKRNN